MRTIWLCTCRTREWWLGVCFFWEAVGARRGGGLAEDSAAWEGQPGAGHRRAKPKPALSVAALCRRDLAKRRSARGGTPWRLDLAWLCEHGVAVPEQLQGLCGPPAK